MLKPKKNNTITHAGRTIYLNNKELLAALVVSNDKGRMSDTLAVMLQKLCDRYSTRGNFVNYSYREDMVGYAMLMLVRTWKSFDATKGSNPFAFFTQCIKNSFIQYLNQEKRHRDIRDTLISQQGLSPSFGFSDDNADTHFVEDEQDFEYHKDTANQLFKQSAVANDPIVRDDTGHVIDIVDFEEEISDNSIELQY